jgi:xanthine dehydrogenase accessory factor
MSFWQRLHEHLDAGQPAHLTLVARNSAHSPGTRGARLFVRPDGTTHGTIGGGIMEAEIIEEALERLEELEASFEAETLYHRKKGQGAKSGLICAGKQTNVHYLCIPGRDDEVVAEVAARVERGDPGLLVIDADGMHLEDEETLSRTEPPIRLREIDGATRYEEQLVNWKRAAVVGGGHCGLAMSRALSQLGYHVTNFDTRPDVFTFESNEWADRKIAVDDYIEAGSHIEFPEITHVIVMTSDYPSDVRGLLGVVGGPYPYIGVMGSAAKLHQIYEDLRAEQVDEDDIEALYAPIGLEMTSNTPAEIAISIAAELLRERPMLFPHARPEDV